MTKLLLLAAVVYMVYSLFKYLFALHRRSKYRPYGSPEELIAKADKAFSQNQLLEAKTYLERAQILDDRNGEVCNKLGFVMQALGDYDDALEQYKNALQLDPNNDRTHLAAAELLSTLHRYDDARVHYARALELGRTDHAHFSFARMLEASGEQKTACEQYRRALALNPEHSEAQEALARCQ